MNTRKIHLLLLPLLLTSCAGHGYISSSIHTVLGLDVSENPKTQVPHIRFGYVRSGLYYVPTGKSPGPDGKGEGQSVKETPNLVSEIFVNAKFLDSVTINEKFAIGEAAVATDAATQVFSSTAAQQVAQSSRGVGTSAIEHLDVPSVRTVSFTPPRPVPTPPPEPLQDAEKIKGDLQIRLEALPADSPWGNLVSGAATLGGVMDHATKLADESATLPDGERRQSLKKLSDLNEKSKKPPSEWR